MEDDPITPTAPVKKPSSWPDVAMCLIVCSLLGFIVWVIFG